MSEERDFDYFVKSELTDFSPAVAPRIWENIVAERSKRKPVGFWANFLTTKNVLLVAGLLIAGSASVLLMNRGNTTNTNSQSKNEVISINVASQAAEANKTVDGSLQNQIQTDVVSKDPSINFNATADLDYNVLQQKANNIFSNNNISQTSDDDLITTSSVVTTSDDQAKLTSSTQEYTPERLKMLGMMNTIMPASQNTLQSRLFPNVALPGCPTVEEAAAGNKRYIEVYVGPDFTLRNFKDTSQSLYLQKRKASTKVSSAYSAGIRYTRVFNNGMSIKAGLNYSQINEKFSFVQSNLIQTTYTIDPVTGDTTGSYTITGTRTKTTYNKYRTLDIPLLVGYELGNGRLHININAGAMINVYSWQRGEVLDTTFQPVTITTGKSASSPYQFKNNVGVGLTGGVGFYYKLTDQLHLLAEPYFRYNLQPMSKSGLALQQKYNTIGLHLGVRLDLE